MHKIITELHESFPSIPVFFVKIYLINWSYSVNTLVSQENTYKLITFIYYYLTKISSFRNYWGFSDAGLAEAVPRIFYQHMCHSILLFCTPDYFNNSNKTPIYCTSPLHITLVLWPYFVIKSILWHLFTFHCLTLLPINMVYIPLAYLQCTYERFISFLSASHLNTWNHNTHR